MLRLYLPSRTPNLDPCVLGSPIKVDILRHFPTQIQSIKLAEKAEVVLNFFTRLLGIILNSSQSFVSVAVIFMQSLKNCN